MDSQSRGKEEICAFATFEVFSRDIFFFLSWIEVNCARAPGGSASLFPSFLSPSLHL